jgi:hypothetical protein
MYGVAQAGFEPRYSGLHIGALTTRLLTSFKIEIFLQIWIYYKMLYGCVGFHGQVFRFIRSVN